MKLRITISLIGVLVLIFGCGSEKDLKTSKKPNIVFIVVDDLGWTDTGFNGSSFYETPNMDKLVADGANFTQAYAAAAVCSPTRASIVTGQYPARLHLTTHIPSMAHGWNRGVPPEEAEFTYEHPASAKQSNVPNRNFLPVEKTTIAEVLKQKGYTTGYIGKWHLGSEDYHPIQQGFDKQKGVTNYGQPMSYYAPYKREHRGETYAMESLQQDMRTDEYLTDRLGREAVGFIEKNKNNLFFLQLAFYSVHTPIQPPKEKLDYFKGKEKGGEHSNAEYAAMIYSVDKNIGKVMNRLKELGLEENTVVILYSDNGGFLSVTSNKPLRKGKGYAYEGGIRVPLAIKWPAKISAGQRIETPVSSVDFFPTFTEMADVNYSQDYIDGTSILSLLNDKKKERPLYWHFPHYRGNDIVPYSIIRQGDWKLIKRYEGKTFELFNIKDDISEKNDLSNAKPEIVSRLNKRLMNWLEETNASIPN